MLWLALAIVVLLLPACRRGGAAVSPQISLNLDQIFPPSLKAIQVQRLDDPVAGDPPQWLVLYEYDIYEGAIQKFSPIAGVVYRADRGISNHPPVIYPYPLRLPDRDYLGTGEVVVKAADVLSAWDGPEVVVENKNTDGFVTEAAVFFWNDPYPAETWHDPEYHRAYVCLGFFRADGGVEVKYDEAIITRLQGDRSQLARFHKYKPDNEGSYFISGAQLRPSVDSWIGFAFGAIPADKVIDSPYPEKIVMAFYDAVGGPTDILKPFLSIDAQNKLDRGLLEFGCDRSPGEVGKVTVRQISYFPGIEAQTKEEEARQSLVELKIRCEPKAGGTASGDISVGWFLKRESGQWKMDRFYRP